LQGKGRDEGSAFKVKPLYRKRTISSLVHPLQEGRNWSVEIW
jgi:hypothetical protein